MERIINFIKGGRISFLMVVGFSIIISSTFSSCATGTSAKNNDPKPTVKTPDWADSLQGNDYVIKSIAYQKNPSDTTVYSNLSSSQTIDTTKMSSSVLNQLFVGTLPGHHLFFGYQTIFMTLNSSGETEWLWEYNIDNQNALFSLYNNRIDASHLIYSFKIDKKSTKTHLILYTPVGNSSTGIKVFFGIGDPVTVYGMYIQCDFTAHYNGN